MISQPFPNPVAGQILIATPQAFKGASGYRVENNTPFSIIVAPGAWSTAAQIVSNQILTIPPTQALGFSFGRDTQSSAKFSLLVQDTGLGVTFPSTAQTQVNFVSFLPDENALNQANNNYGSLLNPSGVDTPAGFPYSSGAVAANNSTSLPVIDCQGWSGVYFALTSTITVNTGNTRGCVLMFVRFASDSGMTLNVTRAFNYAGYLFSGYVPKQARYCQITVVTMPVYPPQQTAFTYYVQVRRYQGDVPQALYGMQNMPFYGGVQPIPTSTAYVFYIPVNPPAVRVSVASASQVILKLGNVWTVDTSFTTIDNMEVVCLPNILRVFDMPVLSCQFMRLTTDSSATAGRYVDVGVVQL